MFYDISLVRKCDFFGVCIKIGRFLNRFYVYGNKIMCGFVFIL